ncbi:CMRF35-like molecule 7 isoform X1 [Brachyistius frenatus]|uniref:CMRF35-like molecule 7 isoform X1 n=1 Tax=Brachyistius frenatus TaxID=100188 RepID=UPI0037E76A45
MRSMEMTLVIVVFLLRGLFETEAMTVTGLEGDKIRIECSHSNAFYNVKYFCKGECKNEDVLITSRETEKGKYRITDKGNTFFVTISDLTKEDSGMYWCGIERTGLDTYNEVFLLIADSNGAVDPNSSSTKMLVYIGAGLGVVVLALAIVLLILFKHRKRRITASPGKHSEVVYATPYVRKRDACRDITTSSTNEAQETDSRVTGAFCPLSNQHGDTSGAHTEDVYSDGSPKPPIEPDGLFYSSVSFNKHTDCSAVPLPSATATYLSLKCASTNESTVYSNV